MPQVAPYIPTKDAEFDDWLNNFSTLLSASPTTFGLLASDATAVAAAYSAWHAAYLLVTSPTTKTATTVSAKNQQRVLALATVRPYAVQISLNPGVLTADKTAIGVNPRTSVPTPIADPTTYPSLTIAPLGPLVQIVRYRDSLASPTSKAKPYGAIAVELYGTAQASGGTPTATLQFLGLLTKSPSQQAWPNSNGGQVAIYAARWVTRRGLVGPWSPYASGSIPIA